MNTTELIGELKSILTKAPIASDGSIFIIFEDRYNEETDEEETLTIGVKDVTVDDKNIPVWMEGEASLEGTLTLQKVLDKLIEIVKKDPSRSDEEVYVLYNDYRDDQIDVDEVNLSDDGNIYIKAI